MFNLAGLRSELGAQWEALKSYNLDRIQAPGRAAALAGMMAQFAMPAIPPSVLARIAVPTTLIWGEHDRVTPLQIARESCERYRWTLHVIADAADDPTLEQPQAFADVLRRVVAEASNWRTVRCNLS